MTVDSQPDTIRTLNIVKEIQISATPEGVWAALIEELTTAFTGHADSPMPLKLEAWPGGRWFRDLGNNAGHFWGHVQVIKPPKALEIVGPMFMSYPVASHARWTLKENATGCLMTLTHRAVGMIDEEHATSVESGWGEKMLRVRRRAE